MPMQSGDVSTEFLRKIENSYGDADNFYRKLSQSNPVFAFLGSTGTGYVEIGSEDISVVYNNDYDSNQYPMVF